MRPDGPGDHVALYLYNGTEYLEGMLAAFKLRAVPINVNYRYVEEELRYLLDDSDSKAIVFHREFAPKLESVGTKLPLLHTFVAVDDGSGTALGALSAVDYEDALAGASPERGFEERSPDDRQEVLYVADGHGTLYVNGEAHALELPSGKLGRVRILLVGKPDAREHLLRTTTRFVSRHAPDVDRRLDDVLKGGHVPEEVERLEDHPDLRAVAADLAVGELVEPVTDLAVADEAPVDPEAAGVDLLEVVDAAQERRLARPGRAEDAHHLTRLYLERDPVQYLEPAESLVHLLGLDHRAAHRGAGLSEKRLRRSRCNGVSGRLR